MSKTTTEAQIARFEFMCESNDGSFKQYYWAEAYDESFARMRIFQLIHRALSRGRLGTPTQANALKKGFTLRPLTPAEREAIK